MQTQISLSDILVICILLIFLNILTRIVKYYIKIPMPQIMAEIIDNPLRRSLQPPEVMPLRHGIEPGMLVLEVGPGNGRYTMETARRVGENGKVIAIDIQLKMIERVLQRAQSEGLDNIEARLDDVHALTFADNTFDAVYMIAVIGEIPQIDYALQEFYRVLKPCGLLAFSEMLPDPDYLPARALIRRAERAHFRLKQKSGNFFSYNLVFEK